MRALRQRGEARHDEGWQEDYDALFQQVDAGIGPAAKARLAAEVVFLTHHAGLHEVNLRWHPKAESLLWTPDTQEAKVSQGGSHNVRYRTGLKGRLVAEFKELLARRLPYCQVRYAFCPGLRVIRVTEAARPVADSAGPCGIGSASWRSGRVTRFRSP